jgi:hypothetical protein
MRCCRHRTWTGCCIYISASKHGAVCCCCACFAPRLDGKFWSTLGCGSNAPTLSCACFYQAMERLKSGDWAGFGAELDAMRGLLEDISRQSGGH